VKLPPRAHIGTRPQIDAIACRAAQFIGGKTNDMQGQSHLPPGYRLGASHDRASLSSIVILFLMAQRVFLRN
jgi:hypothetical protein